MKKSRVTSVFLAATALALLWGVFLLCPGYGQQLSQVPDKGLLKQADEKYLAVFEVDDVLVGKDIRQEGAGELGVAGWQRLTTLFPLSYRKKVVEFNVVGGRRWAGNFDGGGTNDVQRKGFRIAIAKFVLEEESNLNVADRAVTPRRGTMDWTVVHEMAHYITLRTYAIELFSQEFDGDNVVQPNRREKPDDYPGDGSPVLDGNFVTSYAERNAGDEEVAETFTTYLLVETLPKNDSLVAQKIRFFDSMPGYPELRKRIQAIGK